MAKTLVFCVILAGFLLSACASIHQPEKVLAPAQLAPYRATIALTGRLSVNYQKNGKAEALSGKFVWQQSAEGTDVSLLSPFGQTIATIVQTPLTATLTQSGQAPRVAADLDTLSVQALGWTLPVAGLRHWLQGYAVSDDGRFFAASEEHDSVTTADGWRLHFVSWQQDVAGLAQPKRIDAERRAASDQIDALSLRIVIDSQE